MKAFASEQPPGAAELFPGGFEVKSGCGGVGGAVESEQPDAAEPVVGVRVLGIDFENAGEVCGSLPAIACLLCEEPEIVKRIVVVRIGGDRFFKPVFRPFRILLRSSKSALGLGIPAFCLPHQLFPTGFLIHFRTLLQL